MLFALDNWKRMEFYCWVKRQIQLDRRVFANVIFSDESIFKLNGRLNRQTNRYWASKNPNFIANLNRLHDKQIMVWIGIRGENIIGKFLYLDNDK